MGIKTIDGYLLSKMIIAGTNELNKNRQIIDELNVFPVPDGDTGSNMFNTVNATAIEIMKINSPNASEVTKAASYGALRGARGNSGVILSQLFRGFDKGVDGSSIITTKILANAFTKASDMAYKAVMKPREGTMLTIAKAFATKSQEMAEKTDDIEIMMEEVLKYAHKMLIKTTDMLEELKMANVVDAGGKGLICIVEGAFASIHTKEEIKLHTQNETNMTTSTIVAMPSDIEIKFVYCTEFFINTQGADETLEEKIKMFLDSVGDSIVAVCDDDIIKIHLHTNNPGKVLEYALKIGSISNIKIENMKLQHTNIISFVSNSEDNTNNTTKNKIRKNIGIISIVAGEGFVDMFKKLGVDEIVLGGQSMNPSTDDILKAIDEINAQDIIILPNNKNIILVAEQAAKMSNKKTHVIPTKTVPEGIVACISFDQQDDIEHSKKQIGESVALSKTGQVTYAVRDTVVNDKQIIKGDILCIVDDKIEIIAQDINAAVKELVDFIVHEDSELISIYYGDDVKEEDAQLILEKLEQTYPELEIGIYSGGQPLYYYMVCVE
jgi:uncharacterized protein